MATDVAIDIGTASTRLATSRGVVFDEPTQVAIDTSTGDVIDIGHGALDLVGRTTRHIVVFRPLAQGATVDFDVTSRLIAALFERANVSKFSRARVVMSVPSLATSIERRALRQAALQAGAKEVTLIEAPIAAAVGLGLPVQDPIGSAVAVLGAGASEAALLSLGGIVTSGTRRIGGSDIEAALGSLLRVRRGVVVAPGTLEALKIAMGSARRLSDGHSVMVAARTVNRGRPVEVEVTSAMVNEALSDVVAQTARLLEECLSDAPPDLSQDISERGLTLVGGHAQLRDFTDVLALATGLTVTVPENPATVVIRGLQLCLEEMASLHAVLRNVDR